MPNFGQGAPGVRIELIDNSQINLNVAPTTIGGVVGFSSRGAFNKVLSLTSPAQMDTVLGNGFNNPAFNQGLYAGKAVLRNGGFIEFVRPFGEEDTTTEKELKSDTFVVTYAYNILSNPTEANKVRNSFEINHFATTRDANDGYEDFGKREIFKIQQALTENTNVDFSLNKAAEVNQTTGLKKVALFSIINEDPTASDRASDEDDNSSDKVVVTTASYETAHTVTDVLTVLVNPIDGDEIKLIKHSGAFETFTFKTTPVGANDVQIGTTVTDTANNLKSVLAGNANLSLEMKFTVSGSKVTAVSYFGINDDFNSTTQSKIFYLGTQAPAPTSITYMPSVEDSFVLLSSGLGRNFLNIGLATEAYVKDNYLDASHQRHFLLTSVGKDVAEIYVTVDYTFGGRVFSFQGTIVPFVYNDTNLFIGNSAESIANGFKFIINEHDDLVGSIEDSKFNLAQSVFGFVVDYATTGDEALAGLAPVDGTPLSAGDRILVKDQNLPSQNGIYVAASGAWTRAKDANNVPEVNELVNGSFVYVKSGTVNADTSWLLTTNNPIVLGTTGLSFSVTTENTPLATVFSKVAFDATDPAIINSSIWTYDPRKNRNSSVLANAWELFLDKDKSNSDMLVAAGTAISNLFVRNSEELDFTVMDAMLEICEKRKDMFALFDGLDELNIENALRKMGGVGSQGEKARWGALFDGRSVFFDRTYTKLNVEVVKSIEMAGIISNNRRGGLFWLPPAGKDFGTIPSALATKQKFVRKYNFSEDPNSDIARLYDANINPTRVTEAGMIIYGQKTMLKRSTALNRLNVIMLVAGLHKKFEKFLDTKVFQGNTSALRAAISATLNADLDKIKSANPPGLTAGLIICNDTNNTPDIIDANMMMVDMLLQPTRAAEFITLRTTIQRTGDELKITNVEIIGG